MDEWRLEAGDDWRGDIGEGIMAAKVILFIISPKSVESDWCLKELRLGIQHGKIIIPILYQNCELDPTLKSLLHSKKFIDFTDPNQFEIKLNKRRNKPTTSYYNATKKIRVRAFEGFWYCTVVAVV